jgi:radical SAM family uncharacterized protein
MDDRLKKILPQVQKPARYVGGEYNQIIKDKAGVDLRIALCFPDIYEIGMSNLGMKILYGSANEMEGVWCERVFNPWTDMEEKMRERDIALFALESGDELSEFDILAFSIGYEMASTTVLNMLDLARLPVRAEDRSPLLPLVIAGGACAFNPEPLSDFIDLFIIGEGEDVNGEVYELVRLAKKESWQKDKLLAEAAKIEGIYVPSLYRMHYAPDGKIEKIEPQNGAGIVKKRIVDFDGAYYPEKPIVPSIGVVHDRVMLELFRGCIHGCRFCQAGFIYRPVRARSAGKLIRQGMESIKSTGYEEISLTSLSSSDYKCLPEICDGLLEWGEERHVSLSLPSLRADNFSMDLMKKVQKVRKSGLTFAPEAGSQRLRDVINKNITEEDLINTCRIAFEGGWNNIKLYFMLGLPTETDEDVLEIARLAKRVHSVWRESSPNKSRGVRITVSTSFFVPKPHTPFQWAAQAPVSEYTRRVALLRENLKSKAITYNWHDHETSFVEAVLARGDRRIGRVIEHVWRAGGKLESWEECFSPERWQNAFVQEGLDPEFYAGRERQRDEILPWSMISTGVSDEFLWSEYEAARRGEPTADCRSACSGCGADRLLPDGGFCDE